MALHGSMLGPTKTPYLVWLSTTVEEERAPQLPLLPFHRRAAFQYTLPLLQRVERSVLGGAARVLVNSPYIATKIASMGVADTKISLLPVPIDTDVFTPGDAVRTGALFVGRVHDARKNYALLDRVVQGSVLLQTEGLNVVSSVAPPPRPGVTWLGDIPDLTQTYRTAKILVLPSLQEGFGIVAFEALSSGTPVVSMACGGPDEYLRESGGGRVVDRQEDFQGAIEEVLSDQSERERMSAHGRRWVEEQLSARRFLADRSIFRI
jgi:glycosyltransferase involved in cell wall biosynthesis